MLHFQGDWGLANLHRVCGWLAQEVGGRAGPHTRIATRSGRGGADNVRGLRPGRAGRARVYAGKAYPHLRAIGVVPQRDRLVVGVDAALGVTTFVDLRAVAPKLRPRRGRTGAAR